MHRQLNGDGWERAPECSCKSNGWVWDEDVVLVEPVDSIT